MSGTAILVAPLLALALLVPPTTLNAWHVPESEPAQAGGDGQTGGIVLYDQLFPETDVSDATKQKVADNLLNSQPIAMPLPDGQEELGRQAVELIRTINTTTDEALKEQKQRELDRMTVPLLEAGIVIAEKYHDDPEAWKALLEELEDDGAG